MFSVRLVSADSYQAQPLPQLDPIFSEFRGSEIKHVPIIRIFGTTCAGEKTCLHVHGVFPYLFVPYTGEEDPTSLAYRLAASLDAAINVSLGSATSNTQHVYLIHRVSGIPFYGYHRKEHQYLKIYFYNPAMIKRAADLLQNGSVLGQSLQPHEAHIPYLLQFMIDYNVYGMSLVNLSGVKHRRLAQTFAELTSPVESATPDNGDIEYLPSTIERLSTCELEIDALASDIVNRREIENGLELNPGLAAIWEEERARRALAGLEGGDSQLIDPKSPPRPTFRPTDNDIYQGQRLAQRLLNISQCDESSLSATTNRSVAYAAEVQEGENLLNSSHLPLSLPTNERIQLAGGDASVVDSTSELANQRMTPDCSILGTDDNPLIDLLVQLAGEGVESKDSIDLDSLLGSQVSVLLNDKNCDNEEEEEDNDVVDLNLTSLQLDSLGSVEITTIAPNEASKNHENPCDIDLIGPLVSSCEMSTDISQDDAGTTKEKTQQEEQYHQLPQFDGAGDVSPTLLNSDDEGNGGGTEAKEFSHPPECKRNSEPSPSKKFDNLKETLKIPHPESKSSERNDECCGCSPAAVSSLPFPVIAGDSYMSQYNGHSYEPLDLDPQFVSDLEGLHSSMEIGILLSSADSDSPDSMDVTLEDDAIPLETVLNGDPCFTESAELDKSDLTELQDQYVSLLGNSLLPDVHANLRIDSDLGNSSNYSDSDYQTGEKTCEILLNVRSSPRCSVASRESSTYSSFSSENVAPNIQEPQETKSSSREKFNAGYATDVCKDSPRISTDNSDYNCNVVATWAELQSVQFVEKERIDGGKLGGIGRDRSRHSRRRPGRRYDERAASQILRLNCEPMDNNIGHRNSLSLPQKLISRCENKSPVDTTPTYPSAPSPTSETKFTESLIGRCPELPIVPHIAVEEEIEEQQSSLNDSKIVEGPENAAGQSSVVIEDTATHLSVNCGIEEAEGIDSEESLKNGVVEIDETVRTKEISEGYSYYSSERSHKAYAAGGLHEHRHCQLSWNNSIDDKRVFTSEQIWVIEKRKRGRQVKRPLRGLCNGINCGVPVVSLQKIVAKSDQVAVDVVENSKTNQIAEEQTIESTTCAEAAGKSVLPKKRGKVRKSRARRKRMVSSSSDSSSDEAVTLSRSSSSGEDSGNKESMNDSGNSLALPASLEADGQRLNTSSGGGGGENAIDNTRGTTRRYSRRQRSMVRNLNKLICTRASRATRNGLRQRVTRAIKRDPDDAEYRSSQKRGRPRDDEAFHCCQVDGVKTAETKREDSAPSPNGVINCAKSTVDSTTRDFPPISPILPITRNHRPRLASKDSSRVDDKPMINRSSTPTKISCEIPDTNDQTSSECATLALMMRDVKCPNMRAKLRFLLETRRNRSISEAKAAADPPVAEVPAITVTAEDIKNCSEVHNLSSNTLDVSASSPKNDRESPESSFDASYKFLNSDVIVDLRSNEKENGAEIEISEKKTNPPREESSNERKEINCKEDEFPSTIADRGDFFSGNDYSIDVVSLEMPACLFEEDSNSVEKRSPKKIDCETKESRDSPNRREIDCSEISVDLLDLDVYDIESLTSSSSVAAPIEAPSDTMENSLESHESSFEEASPEFEPLSPRNEICDLEKILRNEFTTKELFTDGEKNIDAEDENSDLDHEIQDLFRFTTETSLVIENCPPNVGAANESAAAAAEEEKAFTKKSHCEKFDFFDVIPGKTNQPSATPIKSVGHKLSPVSIKLANIDLSRFEGFKPTSLTTPIKNTQEECSMKKNNSLESSVFQLFLQENVQDDVKEMENFSRGEKLVLESQSIQVSEESTTIEIPKIPIESIVPIETTVDERQATSDIDEISEKKIEMTQKMLKESSLRLPERRSARICAEQTKHEISQVRRTVSEQPAPPLSTVENTQIVQENYSQRSDACQGGKNWSHQIAVPERESNEVSSQENCRLSSRIKSSISLKLTTSTEVNSADFIRDISMGEKDRNIVVSISHSGKKLEGNSRETSPEINASSAEKNSSADENTKPEIPHCHQHHPHLDLNAQGRNPTNGHQCAKNKRLLPFFCESSSRVLSTTGSRKKGRSKKIQKPTHRRLSSRKSIRNIAKMKLEGFDSSQDKIVAESPESFPERATSHTRKMTESQEAEGSPESATSQRECEPIIGDKITECPRERSLLQLKIREELPEEIRETISEEQESTMQRVTTPESTESNVCVETELLPESKSDRSHKLTEPPRSQRGRGGPRKIVQPPDPTEAEPSSIVENDDGFCCAEKTPEDSKLEEDNEKIVEPETYGVMTRKRGLRTRVPTSNANNTRKIVENSENLEEEKNIEPENHVAIRGRDRCAKNAQNPEKSRKLAAEETGSIVAPKIIEDTSEPTTLTRSKKRARSEKSPRAKSEALELPAEQPPMSEEISDKTLGEINLTPQKIAHGYSERKSRMREQKRVRFDEESIRECARQLRPLDSPLKQEEVTSDSPLNTQEKQLRTRNRDSSEKNRVEKLYLRESKCGYENERCELSKLVEDDSDEQEEKNGLAEQSADDCTISCSDNVSLDLTSLQEGSTTTTRMTRKKQRNSKKLRGKKTKSRAQRTPVASDDPETIFRMSKSQANQRVGHLARNREPKIILKRLSRHTLKTHGLEFNDKLKIFVNILKKHRPDHDYQVPAYDGPADFSYGESEDDERAADVTVAREEKRVCAYGSAKKSAEPKKDAIITPIKRKFDDSEPVTRSPSRRKLRALETPAGGTSTKTPCRSPNRTSTFSTKSPGRASGYYPPLQIILTSPKVRRETFEQPPDNPDNNDKRLDNRHSAPGSVGACLTPRRKNDQQRLHENLLRGRIHATNRSQRRDLGDEKHRSVTTTGSQRPGELDEIDSSVERERDALDIATITGEGFDATGNRNLTATIRDGKDVRKKLVFSTAGDEQPNRDAIREADVQTPDENIETRETTTHRSQPGTSSRSEESLVYDVTTDAESENDDDDDDDACNVTFTQYMDSQMSRNEFLPLDQSKIGSESNEIVSLRPKFDPPSRQRILETMETYGIPKYRNQQPYFSNEADVPKREKELAQRMLKVPGKSLKDLPRFVSSVAAITGLARWRKMRINELQPCLGRSKDIGWIRAIVGEETVNVTPLTKPPTRKDVNCWLRAREYLERKKKKQEEVSKITKEERIIGVEGKIADRQRDEENLSVVESSSSSSKAAEEPLRKDSTEPSGSRNSGTNAPMDPSLLSVLEKSRLFKEADEASRHLGVSRGQIDFLSDSTRSNVANENLQNAKALTRYQYLTIMCLEVHVNTRGDLLPDSQHDAIAAIFYSIQSDVPPTCSIKPLEHGVIIVADEEKARKSMHYSYASNVPWSVSFADNEEALLNALVTLITRADPEILIGWELETLSWGYVFQRASRLGMNLSKRVSRIPATRCKWEEKGTTNADPMPEVESMAEVKLPGRIVLDIWRIMRHEAALLSYTFESMMHHILNERVPRPSFKTLTSWWNLNRPRTLRWRVVEHYSLRVLGVFRMLDQLDIIGRTSELARLFGIQFYEVFSRGSQYRVESVMHRLAKPLNYIAVSPSPMQRASMRAMEALPLIMEPESMFYSDPLIVLDFQSLYPSIIIAHNYCFSTCLGRIQHIGQPQPFEFGAYTLRVPKNTALKLEGKVNFAPCGVAFVKSEVRTGILPRMLTEILETRFMVKKAMKDHKKEDKTLQRALYSRQLGLKLLANVTYGYTAANFSGRMPCIEVGDSVVSKSKETLERAIKLVESTPKWGARVVYGDTDSLFILVPGKSKADAFVIGNEIADAVTAANPPPIKLKFEKVLYPSILQTKKRYCGYMYETPEQEMPTYLAKGIETVRRDGCPAVSKVLEKTLKILFDTKDVSLVKKYVTRQLDKVLRGKVSIKDLTFAKEFRGLKGYRAKACVPALELTRRLMRKDPRAVPRNSERVPYIIVAGPPNQALIHCVRTPWELINDPGLRPNAIYYVTRVIIPPLNRCLNLMGVDVNAWYREMPHRQILQNPVGQPMDKQKLTIFQYFGTIVCVSCGQPSNKGICTECLACPADTLVVLHEKLRWLHRTYHQVISICQSCAGQADVPECSSLDCPVLYRRVQAQRELSQSTHLQSIIECGDKLEF